MKLFKAEKILIKTRIRYSIILKIKTIIKVVIEFFFLKT